MKKRAMTLLCAMMIVGSSLTSYAATKPAPEASPKGIVTWYVTENNVNLRKGPGTNYASLGQVNKNDTLKSLKVEGDWRKSQMTSGQNDGKTGYILKTYTNWRLF